jgi:hypothetical protein
MCICNKWPQDGSKRRSGGYVSVAHSTPLLGQQQSPHASCSWQYRHRPGPALLTSQGDPVTARVQSFTAPLMSYTATEFPSKLRFCGTAANDSFCYSQNYSFDWRIDEMGFTLSVLLLKVYGHSSSGHTYITECRAILRRERRRVRVHTTISHGMSRKIYVQCVFVASQFIPVFFFFFYLYYPREGLRQIKMS